MTFGLKDWGGERVKSGLRDMAMAAIMALGSLIRYLVLGIIGERLYLLPDGGVGR